MKKPEEELYERIRELEMEKKITFDILREYVSKYGVGKLGDNLAKIVVEDAERLRNEIATLQAERQQDNSINS